MEDQASRLRRIVAETRARRLGAQVPAQTLTEAIHPTRALAVTSGKGGVGKTNMTVNLALALAHRKQRVLILDADLGLANVDVAMGLLPKFNLIHVIQGDKQLEEIIVRGPLGISVIASGSGIRELANLDDDARGRLLGALSMLKNRYDFLLIDTSAGLSRNVLGFVLAADEILVVTTPEPTALLDAYSMIKVIYQENPEAEVKVIVNMAADEAEAREAADKITVVAHRFIGVAVSPLGYVVRDVRVGESVREQTPLLQLYPHSAASRCIHSLAVQLTNGRGAQGQSDLKGFFARVVDRLRGK